MRAVFIHGAGAQDTEESSRPLLRGLRAALPPDLPLAAPTMPVPDDPDPDRWAVGLASEIGGIEDDLVLIGHSLGGSIILQYLAGNPAPPRLRGVVAMATPFWGMPDWDYEGFALPEDLGRLRRVPVVLYGSSDDEVVPLSHLERYEAVLPNCTARRISGVGHLFDKAPFDRIAADVNDLLGGRA